MSGDKEITIERLQRALALVARAILLDGAEVYRPVFERLEREIEAFRQNDDLVERAKRVVAAAAPLPALLAPQLPAFEIPVLPLHYAAKARLLSFRFDRGRHIPRRELRATAEAASAA